MFTFFCTTCEAKLTVKDGKLSGKIMPCPRCNSMVLVPFPDDAPTPAIEVPKEPVVHKRFPSVLTHETASGIIGHTSKENLRAEVFLETIPSKPNVSETEVKARRLLVGILFGLAIFLFVVSGFLFVFQGPDHQQPEPQPSEPVIQVPPAPLPVVPEPPENPVEKVEIEPILVEPSMENMPVEPETIHSEPTLIANDTLSAIEKRMPGFVDFSVPDIDIDQQLALPIGELNFNRSSLIEFVRLISRLTEIPMTLDIDEMKPRSLSVKTPVSGQFNETTAGTVLTETLATLGLQWVAVDRQILIFPKETAAEIDLTFDVSDFAIRTDDLKPAVLADMVQRLVVPEANVVVLPDNQLSIEKNENNQKSLTRQRDEVLRFLEQLRAVRQLPQKMEWRNETLAPEAFGWDRVVVPMTLNHYRPVLFSRILAQLEMATGLTIIVDHQSLHRALCPFESVLATVQCDRGTVNDVLELLLSSVDLAALVYRIVDHQTLEITTMESARLPEKMVMEVHRYELREEESPEDIAQSLRSTVAPDSWVIPEHPETHNGGNIVIDLPSNCLFVRQSQPAQRQIRLFLSSPPDRLPTDGR